MKLRQISAGFSIVQLLVAVSAAGMILVVTIPLLLGTREDSRRARCATKLKDIVLGLHTYHDQFQRLPTSAFYKDGQHLGDKGIPLSVVEPGQGQGARRAPYSVLVALLPYLNQDHLYQQIDFGRDEAFATANFQFAATPIPQFFCPSYGGRRVSPATDYRPPPGIGRPALTNYKVMGATTLACLQNSDCVTHSSLNGGTVHPYESYTFSVLKAPTQTIIAVETIEEKYAAWWDGTTASIPGFHPGLENVADDTRSSPLLSQPALNIYASGSQTSFMVWGQFGGQHDMIWGASSDHPGLVNHAFGGTETRAIANEIDPAAYRAGVSRRGEDNGTIGDCMCR